MEKTHPNTLTPVQGKTSRFSKGSTRSQTQHNAPKKVATTPQYYA